MLCVFKKIRKLIHSGLLSEMKVCLILWFNFARFFLLNLNVKNFNL
jgi:hypothetical protein